MSDPAVKRLEQAITYLKYARYQVKLALGDTDTAQGTIADIDGIVEDLTADIVDLKDTSQAKILL